MEPGGALDRTIEISPKCNLESTDNVKPRKMADNSTVRFRQLEPLRQIQRKNGDIRKNISAILQDKFQGFRKHGDDHVELAMAIPHAHLLDQHPPVIGAGVPPQIQGFEKLILAGYPARGKPVCESLVGSQKNGRVALEGMQDQNTFCFEAGWRFNLGMGHGGTWTAGDCDEEKERITERHPSA